MKLKKYSTRLGILLLSCFFLSCSLTKDIKLSSYAQKQQLHEIINMLQPRLDEGDTLSSFQLYLLAASYNGIRNNSKALATIDLLQKQIDKGYPDDRNTVRYKARNTPPAAGNGASRPPATRAAAPQAARPAQAGAKPWNQPKPAQATADASLDESFK